MHAEKVMGMTIVYSTSTIVEQLVLGVVFGALGYMFTERYRRARGVTPWKIPAAVWALLLFLSWEIFSVLYLIAYFTTRPHTGPTGWTGQSWGQGTSPGSTTSWKAPQGWDAPVPGRWEAPPPGFEGSPPPGGWDAPPQPGTAFPGYPGQSPAGVAKDAPSSVPPAPPTPRAWLADPSGRHELRYWDGLKFTEHVADGGKITIDPL